MRRERIREDTIKYYVYKTSIQDTESSQTKHNYRKWSEYFADYCRQNGITTRTFKLNPMESIEGYRDELIRRGYSAHTIHTYLAPVCKAGNINMKDIEKPQRSARTIKRGRDPMRNMRGQQEEQSDKYKRSVEFQQIVGLRRDEIPKITKGDLVYDKEKQMYCVHLLKGKGGKEQYQYILPQYNRDIERMYNELKEPGSRFVHKKEMGPHIDYHKMRAELAKESYKYYCSILTTSEKRNEMIEKLKNHYFNMNKGALEGTNATKFRKHYNKFCEQIEKTEPYKLRGEVRANALKHGMPVEYDRLALSCVSVFHLSHWRNDVTAKNYMS